MTRRLFGMNAIAFGPVIAILGVLLLMLWFTLCMDAGMTPGFAGISGGFGLGAYVLMMAKSFLYFAKEPECRPRPLHKG